MQGEDPIDGIHGNFGSPEKKFSISFSKASLKFCMSLHYDSDNSYLSVNGKENFKFKADSKMVTFQLIFVPEAYLMDLLLLSPEKHL